MLNTGTSPAAPPIPGLADTPYWTNRDIVRLTELPASLAVLGGGAIGCEIAQALAAFGVEVSVIEAADRLLAVEEPEASAAVAKAFRR
ncbi:pyruvate/2-oxoglutarate dehydrogenase complex dihydrolipoamide dehydrogenase (E3) component [Planotetraspora sp. GP83]